MKVETKNYTIYFQQWTEVGDWILSKSYSHHFVLVDENTRKHCLPILDRYWINLKYTLIAIPSGEENKHLRSAEHIWDQMLSFGGDRHSLLINLGGGVIGDMGGFCASTFMRGIDFVQVPTTLLSMTDASIGGKLGIDFMGFKNMIGLFNDPKCILIDPIFLSTLPFGELRSGFAENLKHGLIADQNFYREIKDLDLKDAIDWNPIIERSVQIKKEVVTKDPFERGYRKILNFGHTIGHAVESFHLIAGQLLLHGEAIAVGMFCEAYLSREVGLLDNESFHDLIQDILDIYPVVDHSIWDLDELINLMRKDKKNRNQTLQFSLVEDIGHCVYNKEIKKEEVIEALKYYQLNEVIPFA